MSNYTLYAAADLPPAIGFYNIGNTCWCNTLLQALLSCTSFTKKVAAILAEDPADPLAAAIVGPLHPNSGAEFVTALISRLHDKKLKRNLVKYAQECADEAYTLLITKALDDEKIYRLFTTSYKIKINLDCGHEYEIEQRDEDGIKIHFTEVDNKINNTRDFVHRLVVHEEPLTDYKCEKCQQNTGGRRIESLCRVGEIITIVMKKYNGKYLQWFPLDFTLPGFNKTRFHYSICAQIEQAGSINGGHYFTICQRAGGSFLLNDSSVSPSPFSPTLNTYMVFYHLTKIDSY